MVDNFVRRFKVDRVIDGDTVEGTIDFGFHHKWSRVVIRLAGINTPEKGQKGYLDATLHLKHLVSKNADNVVNLLVENYQDKTFGRFIGQLYVVDDASKSVIDINQEMLDSGHAVPYMK